MTQARPNGRYSSTLTIWHTAAGRVPQHYWLGYPVGIYHGSRREWAIGYRRLSILSDLEPRLYEAEFRSRAVTYQSRRAARCAFLAAWRANLVWVDREGGPSDTEEASYIILSAIAPEALADDWRVLEQLS